jgi:predicted N-acetyltransferase YhbS
VPDSAESLTSIAQEAPGEDAEVAAVVERAFGPGRYAKAAERLREGNRFIPELSFVARQGARIVGTVRLWPIRIGERPALLLGPISVDDDARHRGVGAALAERACAAAAKAGHEVVMLVGDLSFFERLGFCALEPGQIIMPGPVDPRRVLVKPLRPGALEGLGGAATLP